MPIQSLNIATQAQPRATKFMGAADLENYLNFEDYCLFYSFHSETVLFIYIVLCCCCIHQNHITIYQSSSNCERKFILENSWLDCFVASHDSGLQKCIIIIVECLKIFSFFANTLHRFIWRFEGAQFFIEIVSNVDIQNGKVKCLHN